MQIKDYLREYRPAELEERMQLVPGRIDSILRWIGRGKRVLEIGSLTGQLAKRIIEQGNHLVATETHQESLDTARDLGIEVYSCDPNEQLPFETGRFDYVVLNGTLGTVFDTLDLLNECRRVLRTDGHLVIATLNLLSPGNRARALLGNYPRGLGAYPEDRDGTQIRSFTLEKLEELLGRARFDIQESRSTLANSDLPCVLRWPLNLALRFKPELGEHLMVLAAPRQQSLTVSALKTLLGTGGLRPDRMALRREVAKVLQPAGDSAHPEDSAAAFVRKL